MKIYRLSDYLNEPEEYDKIINQIYELTRTLNSIYPNYQSWFYNKQINGISNNKRDILFIKNDNNIVAVCCIKNDGEKKICNLFTKNNYRNKGYASQLIDCAIKLLNTEKPLLTINEDYLKYYKNIIKKYSWKLTGIKDSMYVKGKKEYLYNETFK